MVNSPLPTDLAGKVDSGYYVGYEETVVSLLKRLLTYLIGECRKAAKILNSFIDPIAAKGPDKVIPANILQNAKGFAIFTVIKAGFLFSGRAGSGLVVARLDDGSWSAPSAIGTGGMGFGGQIGAEVTDFVIVLNSRDAVKSFMTGGNVTLGGNLSVAAGPIGRTAEGAGSVSRGHVAAIFSYSKTKGLFAGVSIEGSVVIERKDANAKFYHRKVSAKELLSGSVAPPAQADTLYRALNAKASRTSQDSTATVTRGATSRSGGSSNNNNRNRLALSTSETNRFSQPPPYNSIVNDNKSDENGSSVQRSRSLSHNNDNLSYKPPVALKPRPRVPKQLTAIALFDFAGEQPGDLAFNKGDVVTIIQKSDSVNDWWTGTCNDVEGIFPANYVELQ
ncbi:4103_t:CDS:10 [Ambispora gerdemannii]|uniref:4103_t:CDS:1 n=1 Tax=Ambispora gerdemannii TaxID=144530 RepID=A0A9N8VL04_9GLOM|nr:4103_t:CDS:10 [Ambispora gerdemannii]